MFYLVYVLCKSFFHLSFIPLSQAFSDICLFFCHQNSEFNSVDHFKYREFQSWCEMMSLRNKGRLMKIPTCEIINIKPLSTPLLPPPGLTAPAGNCSAGHYCTLGSASASPVSMSYAGLCPVGHFCPIVSQFNLL